jgi:hypothetical protein
MSRRGSLLLLTFAALAPVANADDAAAAKPKDKAAAPAAAPAPVSIANIERAYLERAAITAADKRCNLFTAGERLALSSGLYQSEGELLRNGYSPDRLAELTAQVGRNAKALGCDHPNVLQIAGVIRSSYRQFAKTTYLEYPAAHSTWGASRSEHDQWAANQQDKTSGVIFGLRRQDEEKPEALSLAISMPWQEYAPTAVQLIARDPAKMSDPWLGSLLGATKTAAPPPRSIVTPIWAGKLSEEQDSVKDDLYVYYFSPAAIARLEQLDPREAVQIELQPSPLEKNGKPVRVTFEVGDIRAAHAFAMIPAPAYTPPPAEAAKPAGGH